MTRHIYHHLTDPSHLTLHSGDVYHQYGSTIGRFIFTSEERHVTVEGNDVLITGGIFTNPRGAGIELLGGHTLRFTEGCSILISSYLEGRP